MTAIFNLRASNNATFHWTRDLTRFASVYNLAAATFRMQARSSPYAPDPPAFSISRRFPRPSAVEERSRAVWFLLIQLKKKVMQIMTALDDLNAAVSGISVAVAAAAADIKSLAAAVSAANANNDSAAIEAAVAQINAQTEALNAAVAPVVPAAPEAPAA